jgi:hypothetical protein
VLLRLSYLALSSMFTLLRPLSMSDKDKDKDIEILAYGINFPSCNARSPSRG